MEVDGLPTIEGFAQIDMLEDIVSSCILGNSRFAVGSIAVSYTHLTLPTKA